MGTNIANKDDVTLNLGLQGASSTHTEHTSAPNIAATTLHTFHLNTTGLFSNESATEMGPHVFGEAEGLGTTVTIGIAVGSAVFVIIIIVIVVVCFVRKKMKEKKSKAWVDNLTMSYIADSNIDLTKDNYDEMISLDNDNFLNSLVDGHSFSVYSPTNNNTRQYTYSYF